MSHIFILTVSEIGEITAALPLLDLLSFVIGACIGSFLNVVVWRLPRRQSLLHPPSHCPQCDHRLPPWENVPILAWLFLRGRCSGCGGRISVRYPLVETFTALLFFLLWRRAWADAIPLPALPAALFLAGVLIAAALIDLEHRIIPNRLTGPALGAAFFFALALPAGRFEDMAIIPGDLFGLTGIGNDIIEQWFPAASASVRVVALKDVILGLAAAVVPLMLIRQCGLYLWGRRKVIPNNENKPQLHLSTSSCKITDGDTNSDPTRSGNLARTVFFVRSLNLKLNDGSVFSLEKGDFDRRGTVGKVRLKIDENRITAGHLKFARQQVKELSAEADSWIEPREVLGPGDIKLMAVIGAFTGAEPVFLIIFLSSFLGAIGGTLLLLISRFRRGWSLPFGPYIALAGMLWLLGGEQIMTTIINFYKLLSPLS